MDYDKLLSTAERCINDQPPACAARCPIHIDVAALMREMEKGDFKKAYKLLEKRMPFPRIIGMVCDHPCESVCVRTNVDMPIAIGELERAAVRYGYAPPKKPITPPGSAGTAAVVGGGVSGITAAYELQKKGFGVTLFEQSDRLGGSLWDYVGARISPEVLEEELRGVGALGICVRTGRRIDLDGLKELARAYDAVFLGTGEWDDALQIDPDTFQVGASSVFAGGRLQSGSASVIGAVSSGKRAAVSIERYVRKVSMTASREREGAFVSPLQYETEDAMPTERIEKSGEIYSPEEAAEEAKRCLKCRCELCVKVCAHMQKFNIAPKGYLKQININENVIMGTRYANKMINSCALCGLCTQRCPHGVDLESVVRETRQSMAEGGKMPPSAHDFALKDMEFSNSDRFFMLKSPPPQYAQSLSRGDAPGTEQTDYLFYPGCQLSASSPDHVERAYRYLLSRIREGVGLLLGCCGAPADWAGRRDLRDENTERLRRAWLEKGKPTFILACSSCMQMFLKYLPEVQTVSLWEMIARYGLPEGAAKGRGRTVSIHDACSTRYHKALQASVRKIASDLNYTVSELRDAGERTKCCGYGGLVWYANREQAMEFVRDRTGESADDLLVYCAMCKDLFVGGGKRTYHILDLIFADDPESAGVRKMPNLSERHRNRAELKIRFLRELWNEGSELEAKENSALIVPDDVWSVMEERYILRSDVEKVIEHARSTGARFFNPADAAYLANLRIANVTYWVSYTEKEDGIHIRRVYSHRMEIMEEGS